MSEAKNRTQKKFWVWLSVSVNLGFLCFFKYFNFFTESFAEAISNLGLHVNPWTLKIILPIGISFYTFHGLSYVIDIYNDKIKAEKNFIDYSVFVCFFPLLVAGPIERATHLLPQIQKKRTFDYAQAVDGLKQILWGIFKKVVIADQCAVFANQIFNDSAHQSGSNLVVGILFFTFQIYGDFSGYSDIALGTARLLGIELLRNFNFPFFSKSITEFWRRWHISLSTWFNDYLFTPISTSLRNWNKWGISSAIMITFFLSGLWHGAGWKFIVYGCLHGGAITYEFLSRKFRKKLYKNVPEKLNAISSQLIVFCYVGFAFIFFRAEDLGHALSYISHIFSGSLLTVPTVFPKMIVLLLSLFMITEWLGREQKYAIAEFPQSWNAAMRFGCYYLIVLVIILFSGVGQEFIYFQF